MSDGPMSNLDINKNFLNNKYTKKIYKGVLKPRGNKKILQIVENIKAPSLWLVNTDYDLKGHFGLHWLLVYYKNKETIFFDPLGLSASLYEYYFIGSRHGLPLTRNTNSPQPLTVTSFYCGHYCVIYGLLLAKNKNLYQIKKLFTKNQLLNDMIAGDIVKWLKKGKPKELTNL